jgi:rubredoxin
MTARRSFLRRAVLGLAALFALGPARGRAASAPAPDAARWLCTNQDCDPYIYDPTLGDPENIAGEHPIPPGVAFEDLPDGWVCPVCGWEKGLFRRLST